MESKNIELIISETIDEVSNYLDHEFKKSEYREKRLKQPKSYVAKLIWWNECNIKKYIYILIYLNKILDEARKNSFDIYRKKEYIKLFFGKVNCIEKIERVYNLLSDNDSQEFFEYIIKYRLAYTFIGEEANYLYPVATIGKLESNIVDNLKIEKFKKNIFRVKNYYINSAEDVISGTWYEGQYHYKDICEPRRGDVVISCGAYMGETSIWFADKVGSQGKIYAIEPTYKSYKIAKNNVKRNRLDNRVFLYNLVVRP